MSAAAASVASKLEVISVIFRDVRSGINLVTVPLAEAWDLYEQGQRNLDGKDGPVYEVWRAVVKTSSGTFETWAKGYYVWDFERALHRLVRIGLGANGDGGPKNPDPEVHVEPKARLVGGRWVWGIKGNRCPHPERTRRTAKDGPPYCNNCGAKLGTTARALTDAEALIYEQAQRAANRTGKPHGVWEHVGSYGRPEGDIPARHTLRVADFESPDPPDDWALVAIVEPEGA